jgi:hypothetical protein
MSWSPLDYAADAILLWPLHPALAIFAQRIEKVKLADFTLVGCRRPLQSLSGARNLHFGSAARASMSTDVELVVKSKLPIRLTSRQATGDVLLSNKPALAGGDSKQLTGKLLRRTLTASRQPTASFCSYTRERSRVL